MINIKKIKGFRLISEIASVKLSFLSFSFIFCQIGIEILSLGPVVKSIYMKVYCKLLSVIDKSIIMKVTEHGACWFCLVTDYYPP